MSTCSAPCLACSSSSFASCLSCDTSLNSELVLDKTVCIVQPLWYIQLACTLCLAGFILMPLVRKRSMVLMKILDNIQMVAYFKYINAYVYFRKNFVYLDMRAMTPWNEGWKLFTLQSDLVSPVYLNEETYLNKFVRIAAIWAGVILLLLVVAVIRICCREGKIQFGTFFGKNIKNALCIALYVTVQDLAFYVASNLLYPNYQGALPIVFFILAIIMVVLFFVLLHWQARAVNYPYSQDQQEELYNYELMFLYRMDYDLFHTYELTNLPQKEKKIYRYSNVGLIDTVKKVGFAFLIVAWFGRSGVTVQRQFFSLLGYIVFFQILWYIALPFDHKKEIFQLILNILSDLVLLAILVIPLFSNKSTPQMIHLILCLSLFGLAFVSAFLQLALDLYSFIPYDLYNIGLTVVIEDKELKKELERRKKEQEANQRKIRELNQEKQRLQRELRKKEEQRQMKESSKVANNHERKGSGKSRQMDSEVQMYNANNDRNIQEDPLDNIDEDTNEQQLVYPIDDGSQGDDLENYKIDYKKKRVVYNYNKKAPFLYSNKIEQ